MLLLAAQWIKNLKISMIKFYFELTRHLRRVGVGGLYIGHKAVQFRVTVNECNQSMPQFR